MEQKKEKKRTNNPIKPKSLCDVVLHDNGRKNGFGDLGRSFLSDAARLDQCKVM